MDDKYFPYIRPLNNDSLAGFHQALGQEPSSSLFACDPYRNTPAIKGAGFDSSATANNYIDIPQLRIKPNHAVTRTGASGGINNGSLSIVERNQSRLR